MDLQTYGQRFLDWITGQGLTIIGIVVGALLLMRLAHNLLGRVFRAVESKKTEIEAQKRLKTLQSVLRYTINIVLFSLAVMMILNELGIDIGPVLAAAGIVGVAIGFGSQQLVQDVISGFFILMEDQIRVGDVVQVAGKSGLVEQVNLRMTVLRDLSGNVHYIRNGQIDVVTNMTKTFSYCVLDIGVAYRESVDEVMEVMRAVDEEFRADDTFAPDILEPIEILGLDTFADSSMVIKARIKTKASAQWKIGREYRRRLKIAFDAKNIEIPFPHVTLYMGENKQHEAPPLQVAVKNNPDPGRKDQNG